MFDEIERAETIGDVITVGGIVFDVATGPSGEAVAIGVALARLSTGKFAPRFRNSY